MGSRRVGWIRLGKVSKRCIEIERCEAAVPVEITLVVGGGFIELSSQEDFDDVACAKGTVAVDISDNVVCFSSCQRRDRITGQQLPRLKALDRQNIIFVGSWCDCAISE